MHIINDAITWLYYTYIIIIIILSLNITTIHEVDLSKDLYLKVFKDLVGQRNEAQERSHGMHLFPGMAR